MTSALVVSMMLAATRPAGVDAALAGVRPEAIHADMGFLAHDLLEGRGTASRGHQIAAEYVATRFEALGLKRVGGSYFQPVPLRTTVPVPAQCSLVVSGDDTELTLTYGQDFVMRIDPRLPDATVSAPVVFVGYGISAPDLRYDDYAGVDVRGKIVAVLSWAPASFPEEPRSYFGPWYRKLEAAARHGAVGVVSLTAPEDEAVWSHVEYAGPGEMAWRDESPPIAVVPMLAHLSVRGARALFRGTLGFDELVVRLKEGRPRSLPLDTTLTVRQQSTRADLESPNVIGILPGSDPKLAGEYVVYTAHLDGRGVGEAVNGDAIYNSAFDDASGVAGMLAVAEAFAALRVERPRRSILFLATTAEEPGLHGAGYFVAHPPVPLASIVADINLDGLVTWWPLRDVAAAGARHSSLAGVFEKAVARLHFEATLLQDDGPVLTLAGDQAHFAQQGIPVIWVVYGHKSWDPAIDPKAIGEEWARTHDHKPNDDMNQPFDFASSVALARAAFLVGHGIAVETRRPAWNEGDFFGERLGSQR
jgi:Zn-dependent M28 family amino/carboxypeptidase